MDMKAIPVVLALFGLYMLGVHADPLPLNHDAIGLGDDHFAHMIMGLVLLAGSGFFLIRRRRRASPPA